MRLNTLWKRFYNNRNICQSPPSASSSGFGFTGSKSELEGSAGEPSISLDVLYLWNFIVGSTYSFWVVIIFFSLATMYNIEICANLHKKDYINKKIGEYLSFLHFLVEKYAFLCYLNANMLIEIILWIL